MFVACFTSQHSDASEMRIKLQYLLEFNIALVHTYQTQFYKESSQIENQANKNCKNIENIEE